MAVFGAVVGVGLGVVGLPVVVCSSLRFEAFFSPLLPKERTASTPTISN